MPAGRQEKVAKKSGEKEAGRSCFGFCRGSPTGGQRNPRTRAFRKSPIKNLGGGPLREKSIENAGGPDSKGKCHRRRENTLKKGWVKEEHKPSLSGGTTGCGS